MGRRAAELIGVLVASIVTSYVTGLATASPGEPLLYIVGTAVPLALLLAYWLWIEPRATAERIRAKRLAQAVEDAFELNHPRTEGRHDAERRAFYDLLGIPDLFEPNHLEGAAALAAALDAGRDLRKRLDTDDSEDALSSLTDGEHATGRVVDGARGSADGLSFRFYATATPDHAERLKRLDNQLVLLQSWVNEERQRAGDRAKDQFG